MTPEMILSRFKNVREVASGWRACCPAHDDRNPSLSITPNGQKTLLHCHAGCSTEAIVAAIGLEMKDLFFDKPIRKSVRVETEYRYTDEQGDHLYSVHRIDEPGQGKKIWQSPAPGKVLADVKHCPYRLPEVLTAMAKGEPICIFEGEKCVDNARERFHVAATTNSGGAGKWTDRHSEFLKGASVAIFPDNDAPGREHAEKTAQSLLKYNAKVKIVTLPGLPEKGDIAEWRGTREEIKTLVDAAPLYDGAPADASQGEESNFESLVYIPTMENCPTDSKTLIELSGHRILSSGNISLLSALAGSGKSAVLEAACASIFNSMGDTLGVSVSAAGLLYIDTERSRFDFHCSWQRFLRRAELSESPSAVRWENIRSIDSVGEKLSYLWTRLDCEAVPEVVLIDGIGDFCLNVNDPEEVSSLVSRLSAITDRRNIGIMVTLHVNPGLSTEKARGVLGSELWRKAESVCIIEKTPGDDTRRLTTDYSLGKVRSDSDKLSSYFRWDNEQKMHVSCGKPAEAKGKTTLELDRITAIIETRPQWSFSELRAAIMEHTRKSSRTAEQRIKDLSASGRIIKTEGGLYSIAKKSR